MIKAKLVSAQMKNQLCLFFDAAYERCKYLRLLIGAEGARLLRKFCEKRYRQTSIL